jgi:hypothetical protein
LISETDLCRSSLLAFLAAIGADNRQAGQEPLLVFVDCGQQGDLSG